MLKDVNAWNVSTLITDSLSSGNAVKENANKKVERTKIYLREIMYGKGQIKGIANIIHNFESSISSHIYSSKKSENYILSFYQDKLSKVTNMSQVRYMLRACKLIYKVTIYYNNRFTVTSI